MGTREADGPYIGLLIPDQRIKTANLRPNDAVLGNSDYTQAGPRPGVPEYDQTLVAAVSGTAGDLSPSLSLEALGDQDAATSYHVQVLKGGFPGQDATVVRRDSLTAGVWRGWNTYNVLGHVESGVLLTHDPTDNVDFSMCTTSTGLALVARWDAAQVIVRSWNPETRAAGSNVVAVDLVGTMTPNDDDAAYDVATGSPLDMLVLPSGRVVLYFLAKEIDSTSTVQLWASYSDDHGATWRTAQYLGLDAPLTVGSDPVHKLRAAYSAGNVLLVLEKQYTISDVDYRGLIQYASDDTGLNFALVRSDEVEAVTTGVEHPDILVDPVSGAFVLLFEDNGGNQIQAVRLGSPYTPYVDGVTVTASTGSVAPTHLAAFQSPQGDLYCTYNTQGIAMLWSRDGGVTWSTIEGPFDWNDVAGNTDWRWDVTVAKGRAVWMLTQITSSTGTLPLNDDFLILETGGWNTLCQPRVLGIDPTLNRGFGDTVTAAHTWLPFEKPETDYGWTRTGTGGTVTPSATVPVGLRLNAVDTQYSQAPAGSKFDGMVVYFSLQVDSTPNIAALEVGLHLILDTYDVNLQFSSTQARLYDNHAAAIIGTASPSGGMATEQVFKIAVRLGSVADVTLYRRSPSDDVWTTLVTGTLTAGGAVANLIHWGDHAGTEDSTWGFVAYVMDAGSGTTPGYSDDLSQDVLAQDPFVQYGAPLPAYPNSLYVDQGLFLRGASGPATRGDAWKVEPRFDHPVSAMDHVNSATPSRGWRSVGTGQATVAWDLTLASTLAGNSSIGMFLGGINFPSALLLGWNGAAWVTLATLAADQGTVGLACVVTGDTVEVNTGASVSARYISRNEYVGGTVKFNGGDIRKIVWNSEGAFTDTATKRPSFRFEGAAPGGATATCDLWHPSALVILHENATLYSRYALRIPSQLTADGYHTVGVVLVGAMAMFGRKYARGRTIETAPNYLLSQDDAGRRRARNMGPTRRAASMVWLGADLTDISGGTPSPNFVSMRGVAPPVADRHGTPLLIEGLLGELGGATTPVVYVPRIDETAPGSLQTKLAARERFLYGRIVSSVSRSAVLGTEAQDEVVNLAGFKIEEEV